MHLAGWRHSRIAEQATQKEQNMESAFDKMVKGATPEQLTKAQDFIGRVTTGDPMQGFDDDDIQRVTKDVLPNLSPEELQQAVKQSMQNLNQNMSEADRSALNDMLNQRKAGQGMVDITRGGESVPAGTAPSGGGGSGGIDDLLGGLLGGGGAGGADLDDLLGGLLGGGGQASPQGQSGGGGIGGMLGGLLGGLLGGGGASAQSGATNPGGGGGGGLGDMLGDLIDSPIGKSIIAGAGAFAMKNLIDKK